MLLVSIFTAIYFLYCFFYGWKKESGIAPILKPTASKETPLSPVVEAVTPGPVQSQEKLPQTGSEKASFLAWIGLLGLGFLGGRVKYARRKS